jgi:hypothetical protein
MATKSSEPGAAVPSGPRPSRQSEPHVVVDDAGHSILALLQRAADMAKEDAVHAMDVVHRLSSQLRAVEDRVRQLESEAAHYRDRAARAEAWMTRIQGELEQTFRQKR